jgi:hypothetical protein
MKTSETCQDKHKRRHRLREHNAGGKVYGMDYLDVSDDTRTLTVYFLGKAPKTITKDNVRIEGGRRIRDIAVVDVKVHREKGPERDDYMRVKVDKPGDFSTYTLHLVMPGMDVHGHPIDVPLEDFDPRYAQLDFTFGTNCSSDLDCSLGDTCPPQTFVEPEINYLAKDYASFRQLILDRLALVMPDWKERHVPDVGIALVEILAYTGDYLSYYQDAVATEAYLDTARQRISVRRHVRLVDYFMHEGCNARAWVCIRTSDDVLLQPHDIYFVTGNNNALPVNSIMLVPDDLQGISTASYEVFEPLIEKPETVSKYKKKMDPKDVANQPDEAIQLYKAHNIIDFYTWGDEECCLPKDATTATLRDHWVPPQETGTSIPSDQKAQAPPSTAPTKRERKLHLKKGDILIFDEIVGPKTGNPADADPAHRHVVRLTNVTPDIDPLYDRPIVEIEWAQEDKLPFPLCLSAPRSAPACKVIENISVARGNVILVDHGLTIQEELPDPVPTITTIYECGCGDQATDVRTIPGRFYPKLQEAPLTFSQPLSSSTPATLLLKQDPRKALPQIHLIGTREVFGMPVNENWHARYDLLESHSQDVDFVVEMDNDGFAHLRFGDGESGHMPEAGTQFSATYRVGNGLSGNVGAGAITHIVFRDAAARARLNDVKLHPRNPFPAFGGTLPEPLDEVKLFAPGAFRADLQRAITADDYARLAERNPKVQRAAATLRWTGSWYEVLVAIDPLGKEEADDALLGEIERFLYPYRRIGHDLMVKSAIYVSLDIAITVCVLPHFLRGHVKAALLDIFSNRVIPGGKPGFFHPDNLTFGTGIALSKLIAKAQTVPGVESVTVTKLERLFEGPNGELQNEFLSLGPLEIARLDNDPNFPELGRLVLDMRGGR